MNKVKVSVVVPVYKVEKYLERCVNSIIKQSLSELEIILVDDGSPDNCGIMCDSFADKDNRIKVVHKSNGGLSSARNAGINVASGEYIGFVDSDDDIDINMYEKMYSAALKHKVDFVMCDYQRILENNNSFNKSLSIDSGFYDKEKIKKLKENIDVLTMTATPIPRTLHMSIVGVRDMSVIYEPPHNRKPVQTYVLEFDEEIIKEAITKELERDGQVFYLFNNVEEIEKRAHFLSELVPEAEVGFAHGKMTGRQLEDIMMQFIKKEINVLVCTTILESGIDIPNANTIIVENADRLGLAQLYQIRGRVGRSNKQAYAYITYKRDKLLTEVADKRLKAMREFTEFGSGFKIAMRDLEIRGAGSLLRRNTTWAYGTSWI